MPKPEPGASREPGGASAVGVGVSAVAIWLGWQIILTPVTQRAPPALAVRLAPSSPLVLSRVAEREYAEGRFENAGVLARETLAKTPFDVRALRVAGMVLDRAGEPVRGNEAVTIAGNWSLRDDPAHAWLIEKRLRQGDLGGAMGHADTLARRREDIQPQTFQFFVTVAETPRGFGALVRLMAVRPPWQANFLNSLFKTPEGRALAANLAVSLRQTGKPLPPELVTELYYSLLYGRQHAALALVRSHMGDPNLRKVVASDFRPAETLPFGWRLSDQVGLVSSIEPDNDGNLALWVSYDGVGATGLVEQLLTLEAGDYILSSDTRGDGGNGPSSDMGWAIVCGDGAPAPIIMSASLNVPGAKQGWQRQIRRFQVPAGCPIQWLRLTAPIHDRSVSRTAWFDNVSVRRE